MSLHHSFQLVSHDVTLSSRMSVAPFLSSQVYFITGSTGFLGKVLLAKVASDFLER